MKGNKDFFLDNESFPNEYVPDSQKDTKEFGLKIGKSIQYEWFKQDNGAHCDYYSRWDRIHELRLYARGKQSLQKYKNELAVDGDLSHLNLDWSIVPIIPKFVDIMVNGASERLFHVRAYAQDAMSSSERNSFQDNIETDMVSKDLLLQLKEDFDIDAFNSDPANLPVSDEELSLKMQLEYKPTKELANEAAINTLFAENYYEDTKRTLLYDLVTVGKAVARHDFVPGKGVEICPVDVAELVHSYTEDPNMRDVFYWGEVKPAHITELKKINPRLTKEEIEDISESSSLFANHYRNSSTYRNSVFDKDQCLLLYFSYKTDKKIVHKHKKTDAGIEKAIKKTDEFNPPEEMMYESDFEKTEKCIDVWYDGVMVLGTNHILRWELAKNMIRPKSATQKALSRYVGCMPRSYKGDVESHLERMIPFGDLIQLTHLKLQQVIQRVVPDGVFIDADGINEVDLGEGQSYHPNDALRMYFQTGSVIGRSVTEDGEFNHARIPIQELNKNSGQGKINSLITSYNHYLNMLRDVTGLNQAVDASKPDPNSLVGLQKLAALNSNVATRHILQGLLNITKGIAEGLTCRVSDILEHSDFAEKFTRQIGKYNVDLLQDIKDLYLSDFAIFIDVAPDAEEENILETNIQKALDRGNIDIEDAIDIREVSNVKLANQLLKLKRRKKEEKDQALKEREIQMQSQANIDSQNAAAQIALQKIQAETMGKISIARAETGFKIEETRFEREQKEILMEKEFLYQMQIKGVEADAMANKENTRDDRKDKRSKMEASQQSKIAEQRRSGGPAINFESNEDSLDGLDFSEFGPR